MSADALRLLRLSCDFAIPLAMGLNLGINVRAEDGSLTVIASLDGEQITSAIIMSCAMDQVAFRRTCVTRTMLWLGDVSIVLTPAEAAKVEAFLNDPMVGRDY